MISIKKIRARIEYYILVILYRLCLDISFEKVISTAYAYDGFYNEKTKELMILSWIILLFFSRFAEAFFQNNKEKVSAEIVYWLFLMSFVPFTSLLCFGNTTPIYNTLNLIYWVCFLVFMRIFVLRREVSVKYVNWRGLVGEKQVQFITLFSALVVLYISGRYTHFRINFNLSDVYVLRAEAASFSMPTVLVYLHSWTRNINSILIAYYLRRKKTTWTIACVLIQLLNFGIDGSKSTLFLVVFVIIINLLPRIELYKLNRWILRGFASIMLGSLILYTFFGNLLPISLFMRRVLYIPGQISVAYVDFFTKHIPDYFRQGFLRHFGFQSPYPPISLMIAERYWNQASMANNGLISDAITNLGIPGIVIFPLLLSVVFRWMDSSARGLDNRIYIAVALYTSLTLTNSFLFTVLLTHGLLVTILLLKMMRREEDIYGESLPFN